MEKKKTKQNRKKKEKENVEEGDRKSNDIFYIHL